MKRKVALAIMIAVATCAVEMLPTAEAQTGNNMWRKYVKTDVYEDRDTYIPTPQDFGEYVGLVVDDTALVPYHLGDTYRIIGFRTWVWVSESKSIDIGIVGDDGVALYLDGDFVCGRAGAWKPMSNGTMVLSGGCHKIEALVHNGWHYIKLNLDKKISDYVDAMNADPTFVGGFWVPVDKFGLLAPYIALTSTLIVATVAAAIYVKRVKRRKEKQ